jgi:nucleotide-binding universal stress UspA family protein
MSEPDRGAYSQAIEDFHRARNRAIFTTLLGRLQGHPIDLMSFDEVRQKLHPHVASPRELHEIPVGAIVGSVGRYEDFTRSFLPRDQADEQRWAAVKAISEGMLGLPPIEVYQVGEAYFVRDGHHRVSVAKAMGSPTIEAYVVKLAARVPVGPTDDTRDLILKAEQTEFLEATRLDQLRPAADIELSELGRYPQLRRHIDAHHYIMGQEREREIPYQEAAADWYDHVYLPVVMAIRQRGVLRDFPGRSEGDLYLWVVEHREELRRWLGWDVGLDQAAEDLAAKRSSRAARVAERVGGLIADSMIPESLESGPPPGDWRRQVVGRRSEDRLFRDILVGLRADEQGWQAVEQAVEVAARESARLLGLHVLPEGSDMGAADGLRERFDDRVRRAGLRGHLIVQFGAVTPTICDRARWVDLVVLGLAHPPSKRVMARLGSGLRRLIRSCPRPLLVVPGQPTSMARGLLAYDNSAKAREALYIAAYMADAWGLSLDVLAVQQRGFDPDGALASAREYLEGQGVQAAYRWEAGPVADTIRRVAAEWDDDLVLMGGYGATPVVEAVAGSEVDEVMRRIDRPLLISR